MSKNASKLHVVLVGAQLILESLSSSFTSTLGFLERNGNHRLEDEDLLGDMKRRIRLARTALDLTEEYVDLLSGKQPKQRTRSTTGKCTECGQLRLLFIKGPKAKKASLKKSIYTEACPDWPEGKEEDPNYPVSDEEE